MPEEATPLQRAWLLAALSAGTEIMRLRRVARRLGLNASVDPVLEAVAAGSSRLAIAHLERADAVFAEFGGAGAEGQSAMRARGSILALSEVLIQHGIWFDGGGNRC